MPKTIVSAKKVRREVKVSLRGSYRVKLGSNRPLKVGQMVLDDLTGEITKITAIKPIVDLKDRNGNIVVYSSWEGNWIQVESRCKSDWDGTIWDQGWRYEWELSPIEKVSVNGK